jgi:hypothetical protein
VGQAFPAAGTPAFLTARNDTSRISASFSVRRGTRVMLRSDYAVRISAALAARIVADVPRK